MSNLVGPAYDAICPKCGKNPMGNAAGLGMCNFCCMCPSELSKTSVPFLQGFKPVCTEFVRGAMMKPYRVRAYYDTTQHALVATREYSWRGGRDLVDIRVEDDGEVFRDPELPEQQQQFLAKLSELLVKYYAELSITCVRRDPDAAEGGRDNVGIYPLVPKK